MKSIIDTPLIRTVSGESWLGMPVAAYQEHHPLPDTPEARGVFGKVRVIHDYCEHWSTPGEYEFPMRLYTEDSVRGLLELYEEEIAQLKDDYTYTVGLVHSARFNEREAEKERDSARAAANEAYKAATAAILRAENAEAKLAEKEAQ